VQVVSRLSFSVGRHENKQKEDNVIKSMLRWALKLPIQMHKRHMAKSVLPQLTSHEYPRLKAVGDALYESLNNTMSAEEQEVITLIEQRRSFLLRLDKKITKFKYGAGSPGSKKTKEEMEKGVQTTACVADICKASKSAFWATVLFKLIRKLTPSSCVELGSCVGISASYQAAALKINGKGNLYTLEGSPEIAKIAQETLESLNLQNAAVVTGPFHKTLKGVLESLEPIDFFFNDGHHDHDAVLQYFYEALPYFSNEAAIIVDDISWSPGMRKAWTEIEDDERVTVSIDLQTMGIALIGGNVTAKVQFRIPL
jgi:predicted O-methyltransferase YrrM